MNQQGQVEFSWKVVGNELPHPLCTRESPFDDAATSRSLYPNFGADSSKSDVDKASSNINIDSLLSMPCQTLPCGAQNQVSSPSPTLLEITDSNVNDGGKACFPTNSELDRQLRQFAPGIRKNHDFPYSHERLLYFPFKEAKRRNGHLHESYRTYSQFWLAKKNRASVRMVICSVPQGTYTWGAALISHKMGEEPIFLYTSAILSVGHRLPGGKTNYLSPTSKPFGSRRKRMGQPPYGITNISPNTASDRL